MVDVTSLFKAISAAAPEVVGVSLGDLADRSTWKVQLAEGAGQAAIDAAQAKVQAVINGFSIIDRTPADEVEDRFTNDKALRALAAVLMNRLGLTRPQLIALLRNNAT